MSLLNTAAAIAGVALGVLALLLLWLEARHRLRPSSPLRFKAGSWSVSPGQQEWQIEGTISIENPHGQMEVFVPELTVVPTLLGRGELSGITVTSRVEPQHPDEEARNDGYWFAYIVKGTQGNTTGGKAASTTIIAANSATSTKSFVFISLPSGSTRINRVSDLGRTLNRAR